MTYLSDYNRIFFPLLLITIAMAVYQSLPLYEFSYLNTTVSTFDETEVIETPASIQFLDSKIHYIESDLLDRTSNHWLKENHKNDALVIALDRKIKPPNPESLSWKVLHGLPQKKIDANCHQSCETNDENEAIRNQLCWLRCEYKHLFLEENIWIPLKRGTLYDEGYNGLYFLALYDYPNVGNFENENNYTSLRDGLQVTLANAKSGGYERVFLPLLGTGKHLKLSVEYSMDSILTAITNQIEQNQSVSEVFIVVYKDLDERNRYTSRRTFEKLVERLEAEHGGKIYHEKKKVGWLSIVLLLVGLRLSSHERIIKFLHAENTSKLFDSESSHKLNWKDFLIWFGFYLGIFSLANDLLENLFEASLLGRIIIFSIIALSPPITRVFFKEHMPKT